MEKLLEGKENTFCSIRIGRPTAERLSSGDEQTQCGFRFVAVGTTSNDGSLLI
jgi:hypothetical protein